MVPTLYDKNKWYVKKYLPSYVYLNHENNPVVPYGNGFRTLKKKNEVWNENSVMETAVTAIISVSSFSLPSPKKIAEFFFENNTQDKVWFLSNSHPNKFSQISKLVP